MRKKVILICEDCLSRNYHITKQPYSEERLCLKKYCQKCNKYVLHKETR
ncbi:50S ribosomal protein L33 [bacterium]|nr:50S ribosomal protein L33 [bacterium]MBR2858359.1 50S ribosomal protein L33 [bacterium]